MEESGLTVLMDDGALNMLTYEVDKNQERKEGKLSRLEAVAEHEMPESMEESGLNALMDECTVRVLMLDSCDNEGKGDKAVELEQTTEIGQEVNEVGKQ